MHVLATLGLIFEGAFVGGEMRRIKKKLKKKKKKKKKEEKERREKRIRYRLVRREEIDDFWWSSEIFSLVPLKN